MCRCRVSWSTAASAAPVRSATPGLDETTRRIGRGSARLLAAHLHADRAAHGDQMGDANRSPNSYGVACAGRGRRERGGFGSGCGRAPLLAGSTAFDCGRRGQLAGQVNRQLAVRGIRQLAVASPTRGLVENHA